MNKVLGVLAGLIGVALIAFGFYAIAATTAVTDMTALMPKGVAGLNEARAIYAGSFWAMGGIILYALFAPQVRRPLLIDRKSTRLTPVTNAHLVCRLLL